MSNEANTCRKYVIPKLYGAGWSDDLIYEQYTFTDGRIVVTGKKAKRGEPKRADYLLRYKSNFSLAVVEAKASYKLPSDGMQQAKEYAEALGLSFAYSTNGKGIFEYDFTTGLEQAVTDFPTPKDLWNRWRISRGLDEALEDKFLVPYHASDKVPRYYQQIAINRAVEAILKDQKRILLTLATGTGKTIIAFQIAWRLWNARWNNAGQPYRRPRILFLADRSFLVDDPKDKTFAPFGEARHKIIRGDTSKSREIYFSTYQAIAEDEQRPGLYRDYLPDFFDLIIVDEAHRGSAREDSTWRDILEYFAGAVQLGMTATPLRDDNRDTYAYFGDPIYVYSLKQGIQDGFLAPYQVRRIITDIDAAGFRPFAGQVDDYGREIPDREYTTQDFEAILSIKARTEAIARHLTTYLKKTDRFAKTLVFCHDQDHADQMRRELNNLNSDLTRQHPNYVVRVTADEGDIGKGYLSKFQDLEIKTPVILTTSKLLTTGVDAPTVKNVVIFRVVNSMSEFKQIIGRGTRVREDYDKLFFTILDYTGSATRNFADPDFDGEPVRTTQERTDEQGNTQTEEEVTPDEATPVAHNYFDRDEDQGPRKFYLSTGLTVTVSHEMVQELDASGKRLRMVELTTYTGEQVRSMYTDPATLRGSWINSESRATIIKTLEERGIDLDQLAAVADQPEADPFDLLCHLAFNAPVRTRKERADLLLKEKKAFFEKYSLEARFILEAILDKYAHFGLAEIVIPAVLQIAPISERGNLSEIATMFGGTQKLKDAVSEMQSLLYAA